MPARRIVGALLGCKPRHCRNKAPTFSASPEVPVHCGRAMRTGATHLSAVTQLERIDNREAEIRPRVHVVDEVQDEIHDAHSFLYSTTWSE